MDLGGPGRGVGRGRTRQTRRQRAVRMRRGSVRAAAEATAEAGKQAVAVLGYATLVSPIDGVVAERLSEGIRHLISATFTASFTPRHANSA